MMRLKILEKGIFAFLAITFGITYSVEIAMLLAGMSFQPGVQIAGQCQGPSSGVVMTDEGGPLLSNQSREAVQVTALVRTLAPDTGEQVPASFEALQLLHILPIPAENDAQRSETARPIYSPLRLQ